MPQAMPNIVRNERSFVRPTGAEDLREMSIQVTHGKADTHSYILVTRSALPALIS